MELNNAVQKHAEWKVKLRSAISKHEHMAVASLSRDDRCELGQWLHGGTRMHFGKLGTHSDCVHKHSAFMPKWSKSQRR